MSPPPIVASSRRLVSSPLSARRLVLLVVSFFVPPSSRLIRRLVSSFLTAEGAVFACSPLFVSVPSSSLVPFVVPFSVSPSSRPPSRCRLIPVPVSFVVQAFRPPSSPFPVLSAAQSPPSSHPPPIAALCAVPSCSSLVVSSRSRPVVVSFIVPLAVVPFLVPSVRLVVHRRLVRPPRSLDTMGGAFFSFDSERGEQASKGAGRRQAGDGLGQSGESEGRGVHAMGRWQASRRADTRTPRSSYSTGGAWSVLFFFMRWGRGRLAPPSPVVFRYRFS